MKDQNLESFGERIKEIRRNLGLSQKDFAKSINVSNSSLSEIESAQKKPTFYFFFNISKVHSVNLKYLIHGEGNIFDHDSGANKIDRFILDDEIKEMIGYLQIPAIKLSMLAEYNRIKKIFKPLIDEFNREQDDIKENLG